MKSELTPAEKSYLDWTLSEDWEETVKRPAQVWMAAWHFGYQRGLTDGAAGVLPTVEKPMPTFEEFMRASEPVNKERKTAKVKKQPDIDLSDVGSS